MKWTVEKKEKERKNEQEKQNEGLCVNERESDTEVIYKQTI